MPYGGLAHRCSSHARQTSGTPQAFLDVERRELPSWTFLAVDADSFEETAADISVLRTHPDDRYAIFVP
jgi:hypothetical protein